jgi:hypothetical protein
MGIKLDGASNIGMDYESGFSPTVADDRAVSEGRSGFFGC